MPLFNVVLFIDCGMYFWDAAPKTVEKKRQLNEGIVRELGIWR